MSKWKTTRNITPGVYNGGWKARRPVTFLFGWYVVRMLICQRQNAELKAPTGAGSSQQLQLMNSSQPGLGYSEFFP
jgi:hypothetical protein